MLLSERERAILLALYADQNGVIRDTHQQTLKEVGLKFGITGSRIRGIREHATQRLMRYYPAYRVGLSVPEYVRGELEEFSAILQLEWQSSIRDPDAVCPSCHGLGKVRTKWAATIKAMENQYFERQHEERELKRTLTTPDQS